MIKYKLRSDAYGKPLKEGDYIKLKDYNDVGQIVAIKRRGYRATIHWLDGHKTDAYLRNVLKLEPEDMI